MLENSFVTGNMTPIISVQFTTHAIFHLFSTTLVHQVVAAWEDLNNAYLLMCLVSDNTELLPWEKQFHSSTV